MEKQNQPQEQPYQLQSEELKNFSDPLFEEKPQPESLHSKLTLGALICGITALVFFCEWHISLILGLTAIVCGILALKSKYDEHSRSYAWAGIIMGICACLIQGTFGLFPVLRELLGGVAGNLMP